LTSVAIVVIIKMAVELTKDIAELEKLRKNATRGNVQSLLDDTLVAWNLKLDDLKAKSKEQTQVPTPSASVSRSGDGSGSVIRPVKKLTTYAFDESDKFVKLYYTIPGIQHTSPDKILANITDNSFEVVCRDVDGVDYEIIVKGLRSRINPAKSSVKAKSDSMLLVMLKKEQENEQWKSLLKLHKGPEFKTPQLDEKADPSDSLMSMMKTMYDDGDDEMKRTIRKAWHESQSKKGPGFGMDDL